MKNRAEVVYAISKRRPAVVFVDVDRLADVAGELGTLPVIAVMDNNTLAEAVRALASIAGLSCLVSTALLATPLAGFHLATLLDRIRCGPEQHALDAAGVGRCALLTSSARREARFERMREFFAAQGLSTRAIASVIDIAEELVTNALYDAPVEAGYFKAPVPRTEDVELPPEHACEISYGVERGSVFVRVRDPFGALTRERLIGVLERCNTSGVALDESRGGAGLGMWRAFSNASTIAITVIPGRVTDVLLRIETTQGRFAGKQVLAVQLAFPDEHALDGAQGRFAADHDHDLMDESFTALYVA